MIKDELETIEKYIRELEALQYYPQVKAERDSLATEAAQLKEKVRQLTMQVKKEASAIEKISLQFRKRGSEVEELGRKLGEAQSELSSLKDFKAKLPTGSGLTLKKMREQFLRAQAEEIKAKTRERLKALEKEMHSRMPAMVQEELVRVLNSPNWPSEIEKVVSLHARRMADERLQDKEKWPDWFKDYYLQQVKEAVARGLDLEFHNRVKAEAQNRLDVMKAGEWEQYTATKARQLAVNLRAMVSELGGTWWFTCDRCGRRFGVDIGPSEVAQLVGQGTVDITCSSCLDPGPFPFILSSVPHKVTTLTLASLLQLYLDRAPSQ